MSTATPSRATRIVLAAAALLLATVAGVVSAPPASAAIADGPWSGTGAQGTFTVSDPQGTWAQPQLSYAINPAGQQRSWTLESVATDSGTLTVDYAWAGFHSWYAVTARLTAFVYPADGGPTETALVDVGPTNCCSAPSGGFTYTGSTTFELAAGDTFGLRMSGSNGDSDNRLQGTLTLQVPVAPQSISIADIEDTRIDADPVAVDASATSGLPVALATLTPETCTVEGGTVGLLEIGTCTIEGTQAGDTTWLPAQPVTTSFEVLPIPLEQSLALTPLPDTQLDAGPLTVEATSTSELPITLTTLTPETCTLDGDQATLLTTGTCTIEATQDGDRFWAPAEPVTTSFEVLALAQTLTLTPLPDTQLDAGPVTIEATSTSELPVTLTTLTPETCTLDGDQATLLTTGTCTIEATQDGSATYLPAEPVSIGFEVLPVPTEEPTAPEPATEPATDPAPEATPAGPPPTLEEEALAQTGPATGALTASAAALALVGLAVLALRRRALLS
ncbi:hypothetical protein LQF12_14790 [Ruania suaedae]|uniref:hypothetical protein n=1 Tax=Ruania suaedae TaxID=2897774 RepID=UPI001E4F4CCC|nr:hypothetical protein [Ruania suaedae]UFU02735.1 hypothetical protein LQF12_14790 [Ruania suaedae]